MVFRNLGRFNKTLRSRLALCTQLRKRATYMGKYNTAKAMRDEEKRPLS